MLKQEHIQEQLYGQVTRSLIKELFKTKPLADKIALTKSALLSRKLRPRPLEEFPDPIPRFTVPIKKANMIDTGVSTLNNSFEAESAENYCQTEEVSVEPCCFFKETLPLKSTNSMKKSILNQLKDENENNFNEERPENENDLFFNNSSTFSMGKCEDLSETRCSFQNTESGINWLGKRKNEEASLVEEVCQLRIDVSDLKEKLSISECGLSKWKKKALKYSEKMKVLSNEQQRFEKAYEKIKL